MRTWLSKVDNTAPAATGILTAIEDNARAQEENNAVTTAGITLDATNVGSDTDLNMLGQAMARYASGGVFGTDSGGANAYVVSSVLGYVVPKAYFKSMRLYYEPVATNTGVSTVNAFSLGTKNIYTHTGAALVGGEIVGNRLIELYYDPALNTGSGGFKLAPWANALLFSGGGGGGGGGVVATDLPIGLHAFGLTQTFDNVRYEMISGWSSVPKNTFATSTFLAGVFTCGAGEGGLYHVSININCSGATATPPHGTTITLFRNPGTVSTTTAPQDPSVVSNGPTTDSDQNDQYFNQLSTMVYLQPGDTLKASIYYSRIGVGGGVSIGNFSNDDRTNITIARVTK